jgi:predicted nucleic acid-binding Zn ribbon protein
MAKKENREEFQSVGKALRDLLNNYNLTAKFDEASLINSWERIAGKPIARRTKKIYIRNKVLFIEFDSPTMRHDFSLHRQTVLDMLRKEFGDGIITEIVAM